jgi:NADH-quinone oxidoreductase subunit F
VKEQVTGNLNDLHHGAQQKWKEFEEHSLAVRIGTPTCGRAAGSLDTLQAFREKIEKEGVEAHIIEVGCMGLCFAEPLVMIHNPASGLPPILYGPITDEHVQRLVEGMVLGDDPCLELALGTVEFKEDGTPYVPEMPRFEIEERLILRNCGYIDPLNIEHYLARGGYITLQKALGMEPEAIIKEIAQARLRGRGGAGFDTARKWRACREIEGDEGAQKYLICNADEGDPGAFMDRVVLESDPHSVIEGMVIAAHAIGASQGFIYTRAEYPLVIERMQGALSQAREIGALGEGILGTGFTFDIELVAGAGAFVCGESSAMLYSIEGKRPMPRVRPPRSVERGLWQKPTVVNNVKTFALVTRILEQGGDWFGTIGTSGSAGTAVFALAGRVEQIGLLEVPMGTTLREVIYNVGGGIPEGRQFKAVQIGGPAGGCLPESSLDLPVDYDSLQEAGAIMGSGGMVVLDENNCMVETARFFLDFLCRESCGKCSMGRLGVKQMLLILEDIVKGEGTEDDLETLAALAHDVAEGTVCNLCSSAANPMLTTLRYFRDEYDAHVKEKRCPALVCRELITYYIVPEKCERACDHCVLTCPTEAIVTDERTRTKRVLQDKCVKCGTCLDVCPPEYSAVIKVSPPEKVKELEGEAGG